MDRLAGIRRIFLTSASLSLIAGCGGETVPEATQQNVAVTSPISEPSSNTSIAPKELTGGMTLPDDVSLSTAADLSGANDSVPSNPGSSKGMQLPDDLSP